MIDLGAGGDPIPPTPSWKLVAVAVLGIGALVLIAAVFAGYPAR